MLVDRLTNAHLTYCTNVHPGESWAEVRQVVEESVVAVKERVRAASPFGVGLRLGARAAGELKDEAELERTQQRLDALGLYVFTLNGFPYGDFHATRVKEQVYRPDWLERERVAYTDSLARVLSRLVPEGMIGSISTVPGCYKPRSAEPAAARVMADHLIEATATLVRLERETGRTIQLALEPEPSCFLETSAETISFFEEHVWSADATALLAKLCGLSSAGAESALHRHLGVCLDTCHASVEFESPLEVLERLEGAGIVVPKVQLSAGLLVRPADHERRRLLKGFAEDVYLHQTVVWTEQGIRRFVDLPEALAVADTLPADGEWRIHFHVPVFHGELEPFKSTQADLLPLLRALSARQSVPHLEVETYTWNVLPERFRDMPVTEGIARELLWTLETLESMTPS